MTQEQRPAAAADLDLMNSGLWNALIIVKVF